MGISHQDRARLKITLSILKRVLSNISILVEEEKRLQNIKNLFARMEKGTYILQMLKNCILIIIHHDL